MKTEPVKMITITGRDGQLARTIAPARPIVARTEAQIMAAARRERRVFRWYVAGLLTLAAALITVILVGAGVI